MSQIAKRKLTSRKLWLFIVCAAVATFYGWTTGAPLIDWGIVISGLYGLYTGGNAAEHFAQAKG